VSYEVSRRVLKAIAESYPHENFGAITSVDISERAGNVVHVDIVHRSESRIQVPFEATHLVNLRTAVSEALQPWRHTVRTVELVQ
jgi:hypothetical protein